MQYIRELTVPQAIALSAVVGIVLIIAMVAFSAARQEDPDAQFYTATPEIRYDSTPLTGADLTIVPVGEIDFGTDD